MERKTTRARSALKRPGNFLLRVLVGFKRNQGLLLAGAVAYYTLLSIIPMLALILVGFSHFIEEEQLYQHHSDQLEAGYTPACRNGCRTGVGVFRAAPTGGNLRNSFHVVFQFHGLYGA